MLKNTELPGNLLFLCSPHRLKTFSVHFVDLPVLTGIKPFKNSLSVSLLANSNCSLVDGCGSLLLVDDILMGSGGGAGLEV